MLRIAEQCVPRKGFPKKSWSSQYVSEIEWVVIRTIYLHGFASGPSSAKARYFLQCLTPAGISLEVPDLARGSFEKLTIASQLAVIQEIAGDRPIALVGSSLGGYLAALYAARHPSVERLVLLAPAFGFARRWTERLGAAGVEQWRRTGWIEVFHYGEHRNCRLGHQFLEDAARYEPAPDFRQPALIFHGIHDDVVPHSASEAFARTHPNARLELLDSGHELLDVLDRIAPPIEAFLLSSQTSPRNLGS